MLISIHAPREGCDIFAPIANSAALISIHAPREGCDFCTYARFPIILYFNPRTPRGVRQLFHHLLTANKVISIHAPREGCDVIPIFMIVVGWNFNPRTPRGVRHHRDAMIGVILHFNPRTPRGVRQQTLPKSREFAWLNLLICTRGRRLSIRKQTRLCSMKLSFMLFGCEPAGEGVSSWTSHATKSKVRLEGRSAYSQSVRSSAHSDFPGNKSGGCPVRDP